MRTVQQMLEAEQANVGQPCRLIESAELRSDGGGVTVLLYESKSRTPDPDLGTAYTLRFAVFTDDGAKAGGVVSTEWRDA